ncbi:hypothetical protein PROFUN_06223 [Planoprotostelium fungivorum]|uniref:Transmembrane protein n=1 Tax=Planoprotostelium fungivorum TaxID=1890364 RepID=A0A2P6MZ12_9EUKA|nr:hypothetical protein PROFUN_06223 [Planoprotostelium fungivorum]
MSINDLSRADQWRLAITIYVCLLIGGGLFNLVWSCTFFTPVGKFWPGSKKCQVLAGMLGLCAIQRTASAFTVRMYIAGLSFVTLLTLGLMIGGLVQINRWGILCQECSNGDILTMVIILTIFEVLIGLSCIYCAKSYHDTIQDEDVFGVLDSESLMGNHHLFDRQVSTTTVK